MFKQVIYYFMAVVEEGSFSKAAKKYYLSQSAISQQITKLEKDLGFSLFNRNLLSNSYKRRKALL
mgnify:CR=1 FL=1